MGRWPRVGSRRCRAQPGGGRPPAVDGSVLDPPACLVDDRATPDCTGEPTGRMGPCPPSDRCSPPSPSACPRVTRGCTRSSGTGCGCSSTCATVPVTIWSRNERDVTASYPELEALGRDYDDMLLDGEVVALDDGRPSFHALTERMHVADRRRAARLATTRPVTLMVFDLLRLFGSDLTGQPWSARRELLERLDLAGPHWQVPPVYDDGEQLARRPRPTRASEGIVSKRRTAPYAVGRRSARLAQDGAPRQPLGRRRGVAAGGGHGRSARGRARRPARRRRRLAVCRSRGRRPGRHRRRGAGPAAAPVARAATRPSRTRCRRSTRTGPPGSSPGSSWRCSALELTGQHRLRQPAYLAVRSDLSPADLEEVEDA